ncbi:MAG: DedA family protein [Alphaproteobacteria bacterium]|nr:DedA family protein [Rickettsiales bacterium]
MSWIENISNSLLAFASDTGYWGFFVIMAIESTSIPVFFPAEIVLFSAGYLIGCDQLNYYITLGICTLGSIVGALLNYAIAFYFGRDMIKKYGKYFFINYKKFHNFEKAFNRHSSLFTFIGRFLPFVKHVASLPPGLSKMNIFKFIFYTFLGALIFNTAIISVGIRIGETHDKRVILYYLEIAGLLLVAFVAITYYFRNRLVKNTINDK